MEDDEIQDQADLRRARQQLDSMSRDDGSPASADQPEPRSAAEQDPADQEDGNTEH